jgi:hypothetical protein
MYSLDSYDEWNSIHTQDLWIYNKLFLSRVLGYNCGPSGIAVSQPDFYIIRPSFNLMGMSRLSRIEWIENTTDNLHPSEFWCEVFDGEHLSVDFHHKKSSLVVRGERNIEDPLYKWKKWEKINIDVQFPKILNDLKGNYDWINCEFIGSRLIEVHFRRNPDFRYGNTIAIPVWDDQTIEDNDFEYIDDRDYLRKGFYID